MTKVNEVVDAFDRLIPSRSQQQSNGWIKFNCPACGDTRGRAGIMFTGDGVIYHCFNGGCEFEKATGWEPGSRLSSRVTKIFEAMGGNIADIPLSYFESVRIEMSIERWIEWMMSDESSGEIKTAEGFPTMVLPPYSIRLWSATVPKARDVQNYLRNRTKLFEKIEDFYWSAEYPFYAILAMRYRDQIVGWVGRDIRKNARIPHLKSKEFPADYMLNQDRLHEFDTILVVESHFDASLLNCVCTFGNTLSQKQINLLNKQKKKIVLLPDYQKNEWRQYWKTAKEQGWYLAYPKWDGSSSGKYGKVDHIKDAGDAIERFGLLYTINKIMDETTITKKKQGEKITDGEYYNAELAYIEYSGGT